MTHIPEQADHGQTRKAPLFVVERAKGSRDVQAAQRLRYDVFVTELGGGGPLVDHVNRFEKDDFDQHAEHLLLKDLARNPDEQVVGTYRMMTREMARAAGQFYSADEYDLSKLIESDLKLLELGRSCLHPDYRGGEAMVHLWRALAEYVDQHRIDVMFGVASFHGTNVAEFAQALTLLAQKHLAPASRRVRAIGAGATPLGQLQPSQFDRVTAVRQLPQLIKAYLRLGGTVGEGAFVDHKFNTTDICLILERGAIDALRKTIYVRQASA